MLALFARIYRHEEMIIARLVALAEYAPVMLEILLIIANLTTVSFPFTRTTLQTSIPTSPSRPHEPNSPYSKDER